mmetsp:Transcript_20093/g.40569  ORF Transcript_20093/g.40569 Transcript_20093/m.40569 type:complete len:226 (+) Transcript_20093:259-936(+)
MQVRASCFARSREELSDALEGGVVQSLWCEADDELFVSERRQVLHHAIGLVLRVVDHHVQACHHVVLALDILKPPRIKDRSNSLCALSLALFKASFSFLRHLNRDVASRDSGSLESERDGEAAGSTARITDGLVGYGSVEPVQHLRNRNGMAITDVFLHAVHLVRFTVNLAPSLEALPVEVVLYTGHFVTSGRVRHLLPSPLRVSEEVHRQGTGDNGRDALRDEG